MNMSGVKLFRKTGHNSFAIQMMPSGGIVEVRECKIEADDEKGMANLFAALSSCSGGHVGHGSQDNRLGTWEVTLLNSGRYCTKARAFLGAHLKLTCIAAPSVPTLLFGHDDPNPHETKKRTRQLAWRP